MSENLTLPIDKPKFPSLSHLISILPFLIASTVDFISFATVPNFGLGINPFGPRTFPNFPTFAIMSGVEINTSKFTFPELISLIKSSDPVISAPEDLASLSLSLPQITATLTFLPLPFGKSTTVLKF